MRNKEDIPLNVKKQQCNKTLGNKSKDVYLKEELERPPENKCHQANIVLL